MLLRLAIVTFVFLSPFASFATTWEVGPTRAHTKPSQVMPMVQDGDSVVIDQGVYLGDVGTWTKNNLLIRGEGTVILDAAGKNAQGKATWVISGANTVVENIQFTGATVADHNGAGIRQEGPGLTLRHCIFYHNEDGVLAGADPTSDILFEACEFSHNGFGDGQSHNLYIGRVHSFTMRFCYSHDARQGHLVKSRAWHNYIYCNRLTEESDTTSYDIDLPNGGYAIVMGNSIHKRTPAGNSALVRFGEEGSPNPDSTLYVVNNTFVNDRDKGSQFVTVVDGTSIHLHNNIFAGIGTVLVSPATAIVDSGRNVTGDSAAFHFADPLYFDYRRSGSVGFPDDTLVAGSDTLLLRQTYVHPLDSASSIASGIGAYPISLAAAVASAKHGSVATVVYPDPWQDCTSIALASLASDVRTLKLEVTDAHGKVRSIAGVSLRLESGFVRVLRGSLPSGAYRYRLFLEGAEACHGGFVVE